MASLGVFLGVVLLLGGCQSKEQAPVSKSKAGGTQEPSKVGNSQQTQKVEEEAGQPPSKVANPRQTQQVKGGAGQPPSKVANAQQTQQVKKETGQPPSRNAACDGPCVTKFGQELGSNAKVVAYSNCQPGCIDPTPYFVTPDKTGLSDPTYTGIIWQCVEYARRWWLLERRIVFGSVDTADDMWTKVKTASHLASDTQVVVQAHENGGTVPPEVGDLVIYQAVVGSDDLAFGHVAVIVEVHPDKQWVSLAEQNYSNSKWVEPAKYSRRVNLLRQDGTFALEDSVTSKNTQAVIYGWLRAQPHAQE